MKSKICTKCKETKSLDLFEKKQTGKFGVGSWCKECKSKDRAKYKRSSNYRVTNLEYYYRNRSLWRSIKASRRVGFASPLTRSYSEEIQEIYRECPEGFEVDHIVPLRGQNVCGLHIPWNLQYLTKEENRKKGNKWDQI